MPDDERDAGKATERGAEGPPPKWKFEAQAAEALDRLNRQIASLTAWGLFLDEVDWSKVPMKRSSPGNERKPPPPPPVWPPA